MIDFVKNTLLNLIEVLQYNSLLEKWEEKPRKLQNQFKHIFWSNYVPPNFFWNTYFFFTSSNLFIYWSRKVRIWIPSWYFSISYFKILFKWNKQNIVNKRKHKNIFNNQNVKLQRSEMLGFFLVKFWRKVLAHRSSQKEHFC